ncbi:anthranilate phosphoribosyltransferase [Listeria sp. PSOL-1]|uniref:anthranilate phosphoribosyltransferase n=1 Tax=Listeria sp. PSOL-1 TaxID=1844999 RepID=UPI0013D3A8D4|nr:anthranilate phosphoribosyltransferase [Listeria sp. PSOL-1]
MRQLIQNLYDQKNLTEEEMKQVAITIFSGKLSDAEMGALLLALKIKGETVEEITGLAKVMQELALKIPGVAYHVMDNCGTGGDRSGSFNISTTAAFILAAAGIPVAKHGNRSISSKSGSADVLSELGIEMATTPEKIAHLLKKANLTFLFAPNVHPKMKQITAVRKQLATATIFNIIGPLTNPIPLNSQLMGVYRRDLLEVIASVLKNLGRERAVVINGPGGMDEAALHGVNHLAILKKNEITKLQFTPEDIGLPSYSLSEIQGGDARFNAEILQSVLRGEPGAYLDTVLLNAGLGLFACGKAKTMNEGIREAKDIVACGKALAKLKEVQEKQKEIRSSCHF